MRPTIPNLRPHLRPYARPLLATFAILAAIAAIMTCAYVATFTYYGVNLLAEINIATALTTTTWVTARAARAATAPTLGMPGWVRTIGDWFVRLPGFIASLLQLGWVVALPTALIIGVPVPVPVALSVVAWCLLWLLARLALPDEPAAHTSN